MLFLPWLIPINGHAQEVIQLTWPSRFAAEPQSVPGDASAFLPAFRLAINTFPEANILALALTQPTMLGLTSEQATRLQPQFTDVYHRLAESDLYGKTKSALPYCFADKKPDYGLATVYVPHGLNAQTPVLLFIHGYGGSFLWYSFVLSQWFPDALIICPAFGISPAAIPQSYVSECLDALSRKIQSPLDKPCLLGLSAGGFGACRLFVQHPATYSGLICLGSFPPDDTLQRFDRMAHPRFLCGSHEPYVLSGDMQRRLARVRLDCRDAELRLIPKADHFFLLSHPDDTRKHLQEWFPVKIR